MYDEQASPIPLPRGSRRNFSFHTDPETTRSMHAPSPIEPILR